MKDLAIFILTHIVDKPESVEVTENETDLGYVTLTLKVDPADMGKVIGKEGKNIRAIREVIKILALKQNKYVNVVLAE